MGLLAVKLPGSIRYMGRALVPLFLLVAHLFRAAIDRGRPLIVVDDKGFYDRRFKVGTIPWSSIGKIETKENDKGPLLLVTVLQNQYLPKHSLLYTHAPCKVAIDTELMIPDGGELIAFLQRTGRMERSEAIRTAE